MSIVRISLFILLVSLNCSARKCIKEKDHQEENKTIWTTDWSPDDKLIATGGVDSSVRILSPVLRILKSYKFNSWIHSVKWHPDSKTLAIATLHDYVQLLNVETDEIIQLASKGGSRAIDWDKNGELLAVADLDGQLRIWNKNGKLISATSRTYAADQAGTSFLSLDWHPTEKIFVAANFQIGLFDSSGQDISSMSHQNKAAIILALKWHPSGKFFALGDYGHNWEGENVPSIIHFWGRNGNYIKSISGSKAEYRNLSWNSTGSMLASASDVLRIWSESGKMLYEAKPGQGKLWGIDWNKKGERIVTTSEKGIISIWNKNASLVKKIVIK